MNFLLQIKDGQPVGHPMDAGSVRALHDGQIPDDYATFVPDGPPDDLGPYEKIDAQPGYVQRGEVWTHDYNRRPMTADEKAAHIATIQEQWQSTGFQSWNFNVAECRYVPPVPPPDETGIFHWDETRLQWLEGPQPAV